jgi:hypothetical protein
MAIVVFQTLPEGVNREQTQEVSAEIMVGGPIPGCLAHSLIEDGGRIKSVDIWESEKALTDFLNTRLRPAIAVVAERNGQDPSQLPVADPPQIFEAYDVFSSP